MSSRTTSALALLEARPPRTPSQCISLVAAADAGIANDRIEVLVDRLLAGNDVRPIGERQGLKIGVPEEAAWRRGFISDYLFGLLDGWGQAS